MDKTITEYFRKLRGRLSSEDYNALEVTLTEFEQYLNQKEKENGRAK